MKQEQTEQLTRLIASDYSNMAGMLIRQNNETVYEQYFGNSNETTGIHVFSVTKSILSILIGIALDKGYLTSVNQRIFDFFPEYQLKRGEKTLPKVTLEDMLTMRVPYKYRSSPYTKYFTSDDWVKASLDFLGGKGRIGVFRYAPIVGPDILSGILTRATGKPVAQFAADMLFNPLGIATKQGIQFESKEEQLAWYKQKDYGNVWVMDPQGVNTAGWGLALTVPEMANIGQLYLNDGLWQDKQIVSADWIKQSTREHSRWLELDLPYGYLWWVLDAHTFAAIGDGGNIIYVNKQKQLVVAIASYFYPRAKDRIALIKEVIEPAL